MIKFLFQGDSITDASRIRDDDKNFGFGYPNLFASQVMCNNPHKVEFINCGVSGDRIVDLYARMKVDIINLKPDYMTILIGVNDVWHELNDENGVDIEKFQKIYEMLIEEILKELPDIKIILLEPFILKGAGTERYYDVFRGEIERRAKVVKGIADKFGLAFVPLQDKFDKASADGDTEYWLCDGVHPSAAGHCLIKNALADVIKF